MSRFLNPWTEIQNMRREIDRIMDETSDWGAAHPGRGEHALWSPVADMYETQGYIIIEMELPGVDQEKVSLENKGDQLIVYGEKRREKDATGSAYQMLERSYGPFSRKFNLPKNVDADSIRAVLKNGVLSITVPKKEMPQQSVQITIE